MYWSFFYSDWKTSELEYNSNAAAYSIDGAMYKLRVPHCEGKNVLGQIASKERLFVPFFKRLRILPKELEKIDYWTTLVFLARAFFFVVRTQRAFAMLCVATRRLFAE